MSTTEERLAALEGQVEALTAAVANVEARVPVQEPAVPGEATDYTYAGPFFPRVHPTPGGRRLVEFNPHQSVVIEVAKTAVPTLPIAPGIRARPDQGEDVYELAVYRGRMASGRWSEDGTIVSEGSMVSWPEQYRPNLHPNDT